MFEKCTKCYSNTRNQCFFSTLLFSLLLFVNSLLLSIELYVVEINKSLFLDFINSPKWKKNNVYTWSNDLCIYVWVPTLRKNEKLSVCLWMYCVDGITSTHSLDIISLLHNAIHNQNGELAEIRLLYERKKNTNTYMAFVKKNNNNKLYYK